MKQNISVRLSGTVMEALKETANEKSIAVEYLAERILASWCAQQIILDVKPIDSGKQETDEADCAHAEIEGSGAHWFYMCSECRAELNSNARFCSQCGKKIRWK